MTQPLKPMRPPSPDELVYDDGEPMESARHRQQMIVLIESLEHAWRDRDDFYVGGNMFLYFSETQARSRDFRGPDVYVVMNTTRRERRAWVVWEENGQVPDVIVELLSPKTEHVDRGEKMRVYARLRVGEYFLFDPFSAELEGHELDVLHARYRKKVPDEQGRLRCEGLGLSLAVVRSVLSGVEAPWLRWVDGEGRVLPTLAEDFVSAGARERAAVDRANAFAKRAKTEADRAKAEAERANAEAERANAEAEHANAEADRANAEAERANRLAAELAALKAR
jgi:Uma2 family endonuclease